LRARRQAQARASHGVEEIFYGSTPVYFAPAAGTAEAFSYADATFAPTAANTMARSNPLIAAIDPEGPPVVVPCMPALDIVQQSKGERNSVFPAELAAPWVKVLPEARADACMEKAYASGIRSALVKLKRTGAWYRLKGCGNYDEGFALRKGRKLVVRDGAYAEQEFREIRGCAFPHTAMCENFMCAKLQKDIGGATSDGPPCVNTPLGHWAYASSALLPLGTQFQTACIVQETRGDRRLYTHLLAGLSLLLEQFVDLNALRVEDVVALFPPARPRDTVSGLPITTAAFIDDQALLESYVFVGLDSDAEQKRADGAHGYVWGCPRDQESMANVRTLPLPERAPPHGPKDEYPSQWQTDAHNTDDEVRARMDPKWWPAWQSACRALEEHLALRSEQGTSVLGYVFSRVGVECGEFLRHLHRTSKVSWGTYQDSMCHASEWHCNAHANNMVVLFPGTKRYLGYLDLDMAFTKESYVDLKAPGGSANISDTRYAELLEFEKGNFRASLAGAGGSSGLRMPREIAGWEDDASKRAVVALRNALYDTMLLSFDAAYQGDDTSGVAAAFDPALHEAGYEMIKLALICQAQYLA
jgi:hypothetical protein